MSATRTNTNAAKTALAKLMELHLEAERDGEYLHSLGRADGDYHTDDHSRAAEKLMLSSRERDTEMRKFLTQYGAGVLAVLGSMK